MSRFRWLSAWFLGISALTSPGARTQDLGRHLHHHRRRQRHHHHRVVLLGRSQPYRKNSGAVTQVKQKRRMC